MKKIKIISSSVRTGRKSDRVVLYFKNYLEENNIAAVEILDLKEYNFPVFEERLKNLADPSPALLNYTSKIKEADGIILVTPEYNGGYPASIKNAIDVLYAEWYHKPMAIATVSDGSFGGSQVITSLQFSLWKIKAWVVPAMFPVPTVDKSFNEAGVPTDKDGTDKRAAAFINELMWAINLSSPAAQQGPVK
ncbi:MAG: NAD(P)H-dependent oxidoreductase [Ferruginibacter sp.]